LVVITIQVGLTVKVNEMQCWQEVLKIDLTSVSALNNCY